MPLEERWRALRLELPCEFAHQQVTQVGSLSVDNSVARGSHTMASLSVGYEAGGLRPTHHGHTAHRREELLHQWRRSRVKKHQAKVAAVEIISSLKAKQVGADGVQRT